MAGEGAELDAGVAVPDLDAAVGRAGRDVLAVGTDGDRLHGAGVLRQKRDLTARDLPDLHALIDAGRDDVVAVLREGDVGDPVLVPLEGLRLLAGAAFELPELDDLIGAAGDEVL